MVRWGASRMVRSGASVVVRWAASWMVRSGASLVVRWAASWMVRLGVRRRVRLDASLVDADPASAQRERAALLEDSRHAGPLGVLQVLSEEGP
jgi:hypothetical protein